MSKARKKDRARGPRPNLSPLTLLRPRLDRLLENEAVATGDPHAFKANLDALVGGLKVAEFFPVLLKASAHAPGSVQARLDEVMPAWLAERGTLENLLELLQQHRIDQEVEPRARAWLEAAGAPHAVPQGPEAQTLFYGAYTYTDDSQGIIAIFWYAESRRRKVRGMSFLIDYNPPWEGAVKDIAIYPARPVERALEKYVASWVRRGMPLRSITAADAKREVLKSLEVNRRERIRLPGDLIRHRALFLDDVLSLPDTPETPPFTARDFEQLSLTGQSPEAIRQFEQTVGRRIRLQDGKEVLVMGNPLDEEEW